jgi:thiol:disulfide interchange protein
MITSIADKDAFQTLLDNNQGIIVLKFGAEWCGPCKQIEEYVSNKFENMPQSVQTGIIDVDDNFELYAILKRKKIVQALPTIVRYDSDNKSLFPSDSIIGIDTKKLDNFFNDIIKDA